MPRPRSEMFSDIFQWLVLLLVVLLSTSSALHILHQQGPRGATLRPESYTCDATGTPFASFQMSVLPPCD